MPTIALRIHLFINPSISKFWSPHYTQQTCIWCFWVQPLFLFEMPQNITYVPKTLRWDTLGFFPLSQASFGVIPSIAL